MSHPVNAVGVIGSAAVLLQAVPPSADPLGTLVTSAGQLTLQAALIGAIWWLARKYEAAQSAMIAERKEMAAAMAAAIAAKDVQIEKKDEQVIEMAKQVTATQTSVIAAVTELRTSVTKLDERLGQGVECPMVKHHTD
jgi:hypothetical protein